jgi:SAM-dependent methyltransferase
VPVVSFDVTAAAYGRFMGRWSEPLAEQFADWAGVTAGQRALDVGCGPGALTTQLVHRLGADAVAAVDPSEPFVEAMRGRFPGVDLHRAVAEDLPFADDAFDVTLAQLVVHFMADPVAGLREMARVTRPDGLVAASVWDLAGSGGPLAVLWQAARDLDPEARDEAGLAGASQERLVSLLEQAGLPHVEPGALTVRLTFRDIDEWWEPFTLGVGPAGVYVAGLDDAARARLRDRCAELLPEPPFEIAATAWCVRGRVAGRG